MLLGSKQGYKIHPILEQTLLSFQGAAKDLQQEKAQGTDQNSPLISCDLPINWAPPHPADQSVSCLDMSLMEFSARLHMAAAVTPEVIKKLRR